MVYPNLCCCCCWSLIFVPLVHPQPAVLIDVLRWMSLSSCCSSFLLLDMSCKDGSPLFFFPKIGVVISVFVLDLMLVDVLLAAEGWGLIACLHANNLWWPMLISTLWFQELRGGANNFLGTGFMEECRVRVSWEVVGSCTDLCRNLVIPTSNSGVHCKTSIVEVFKRGKPDDFLSWRLVWACVTSVTWQLWVECVCVCAYLALSIDHGRSMKLEAGIWGAELTGCMQCRAFNY